MSATQNLKRDSAFNKVQNFLLPLLDILAIAAWGVMMLRYWRTDKLYLLIHRDYFWLVVAAGFAFLAIAAFKTLELIGGFLKGGSASKKPAVAHLSLFPPGLGSSLLLLTAILGLLITPQVFSSQTALDRGISESLTSTRTPAKSFRSALRPEDRTLIDWVRTLNVYPEPDAYTGQKVKVQGFAIHPPNLPAQYLMIARFILTCCAADAYPVGLPVKLPQNRTAYPPDTWLEIEGQMITENLADKRQLTIEATSLKKIDKPKNPYEY